MTLAAQRWPGEGTPLVAIHGLSSNAMFYVGIAERLAGRRPLVAVDLRGRGDSAKPADGYGMEAHADDVAAAMDAEGIERLVQPTAIERMAATHPKFDTLEVPGTNHYTIALTDPAVTTVADALVAHAAACGL